MRAIRSIPEDIVNMIVFTSYNNKHRSRMLSCKTEEQRKKRCDKDAKEYGVPYGLTRTATREGELSYPYQGSYRFDLGDSISYTIIRADEENLYP